MLTFPILYTAVHKEIKLYLASLGSDSVESSSEALLQVRDTARQPSFEVPPAIFPLRFPFEIQPSVRFCLKIQFSQVAAVGGTEGFVHLLQALLEYADIVQGGNRSVGPWLDTLRIALLHVLDTHELQQTLSIALLRSNVEPTAFLSNLQSALCLSPRSSISVALSVCASSDESWRAEGAWHQHAGFGHSCCLHPLVSTANLK